MKLLLFILLFSFAFADLEWETIKKTETVQHNHYKAVDFSKNARKINYTVTCTKTCDIYLLQKSEFDRFKQKRPFTYLRYEAQVMKDEAQWEDKEDISKRLLVMVINTDHTSQITAYFELNQLMPQYSLTGLWIALGVVGSVILLFFIISFLVVFFIVYDICSCDCDCAPWSTRRFGGYYSRWRFGSRWRGSSTSRSTSTGGNVFSGRV